MGELRRSFHPKSPPEFPKGEGFPAFGGIKGGMDQVGGEICRTPGPTNICFYINLNNWLYGSGRGALT